MDDLVVMVNLLMSVVVMDTKVGVLLPQDLLHHHLVVLVECGHLPLDHVCQHVKQHVLQHQVHIRVEGTHIMIPLLKKIDSKLLQLLLEFVNVMQIHVLVVVLIQQVALEIHRQVYLVPLEVVAMVNVQAVHLCGPDRRHR